MLEHSWKRHIKDLIGDEGDPEGMDFGDRRVLIADLVYAIDSAEDDIADMYEYISAMKARLAETEKMQEESVK